MNENISVLVICVDTLLYRIGRIARSFVEAIIYLLYFKLYNLHDSTLNQEKYLNTLINRP